MVHQFLKFAGRNGHVSSLKKKRYTSFEIKNNELFEKYFGIWDKVSNIVEKAFNTQLVFEEKYLKAKLQNYSGKNNTHLSKISQH